MTHRFEVTHDPAVVARWCALAQQRLDYLTELFQNGRWRRYYSHTAFIENIKEAKTFKYEVPLESQQGGEVMVDKQRRRDHQEAARNGSDAGSISPECSCKQASEY